MDDMNAFERQVAGEFVRRAGPVRPVDAAAIFTAITATQSPKWRFQSMFSATKFVVAGAIVALFGGFLLAGVLTQPSDDQVSVPGATPSAEPAGSPVWKKVLPVWTGWNAVTTDDALWVPNNRDGVVIRVDEATGDFASWGTSRDAFLIPTDDAVLAVGEDNVIGVDTATLELSLVYGRAGGPAVLADDSLWVWSLEEGRSSLVEIDLGSSATEGPYVVDGDTGVRGSDEEAWILARLERWLGATDGALWLRGPSVDDPEAGRPLLRFDLETHAFSGPFRIDGLSESWEPVLALDDAVWLSAPAGTLLRFDTDTLEVTHSLDLASDHLPGAEVGLGPGLVADGAIWIGEWHSADSDDEPAPPSRLHRIDLATYEAAAVEVDAWTYYRPVFADGAMWVGGPADPPGTGKGRLWRIDADTLEVTEAGVCPDCHAFEPLVSDGVIWIADEHGYFYRVDGVIDAE